MRPTIGISRITSADFRISEPTPPPSAPTMRARGSGRSAVWISTASSPVSSAATHQPRRSSALKRVDDIRNHGDPEHLHGACGRIDHGRGDLGGAMLGDDDAGDARRLGGADQRAEILGILQMVEDKHRPGRHRGFLQGRRRDTAQLRARRPGGFPGASRRAARGARDRRGISRAPAAASIWLMRSSAPRSPRSSTRAASAGPATLPRRHCGRRASRRSARQ